jgi:hypothetical protein
MRMPGFTAEATYGRSRNQYALRLQHSVGRSTAIMPAQSRFTSNGFTGSTFCNVCKSLGMICVKSCVWGDWWCTWSCEYPSFTWG